MNGNPVYLPPIWPDRDPIGTRALQLAGLGLFVFGVYRLVLFLEIMMGG